MNRIFLLTLLASFCGCSGSGTTETEDKRQTAAAAYENAQTAFTSKDYAKAKEAYDIALKGGLYSDLIGPARVRQAVCLAELGDIDGAMQEIIALEGGAPNIDEVLSAKSYILAKQGKAAESKAAWAQAIKINRNVKKFGE